ncbi:enoyl-CoA hydratase/isomerase family protein [Ovoidimarina sediminis]|uniref:enoyl-CoA hydratase/isomerase family protein n=1 Tax=Ovoidimarina sediminis TaxID=3079856 RepID=UPI00290B2EB9|nr:enoyl-CoA hydratase/isomerase family protein [Rhodophyticola sp. MJ-SS7]MDU8942237.1 enoyl-CoA hydratase/isomerase family protein [Rhodophyticola sp. MJ-SS7]
MSDINIRIEGKAGRITLNRPAALNALTWDMCLKIEAALDDWRDDDAVALVIIDAVGEKAFCAGGDLVELYHESRAGNLNYGRNFWADEYRLNAKISEYPKPYIAFMQGFTMGGGVGASCHGSHRIVGDTSRIAMPECSIGLIPDVGGTFLLARAPGHVGEYLAVTGFRMQAADAIYATFADTYIPEEKWGNVMSTLAETGNAACLPDCAAPPPGGLLAEREPWIARHFRGASLGDVVRSLEADNDDLAKETLKAIGRQSPLSAAAAYEAVRRVRGSASIHRALEMEYRFTWRSIEDSDFLEGIRALIIDKDKSPAWHHDGPKDVTTAEVARMLMPLGKHGLSLDGPGNS